MIRKSQLKHRPSKLARVEWKGQANIQWVLESPIREIRVKPTVYIETSVISYRAARPSRDLIVAAHQQLTHEWWERVLPQCDAFVSPVVLEEIAQGDPDAAQGVYKVSRLSLWWK